jgi:hypothetical protein
MTCELCSSSQHVRVLKNGSKICESCREAVSELRPLRTPVKAKRAKPRRGPMRDPEYRAWCRAHVCAISIGRGGCQLFGGHAATVLPSDAAHTLNNGLSSKGPDSSCLPLCRMHHREYDRNRKAFEAKYTVNMAALAAEHFARYQQEKGAN